MRSRHLARRQLPLRHNCPRWRLRGRHIVSQWAWIGAYKINYGTKRPATAKLLLAFSSTGPRVRPAKDPLRPCQIASASNAAWRPVPQGAARTRQISHCRMPRPFIDPRRLPAALPSHAIPYRRPFPARGTARRLRYCPAPRGRAAAAGFARRHAATGRRGSQGSQCARPSRRRRPPLLPQGGGRKSARRAMPASRGALRRAGRPWRPLHGIRLLGQAHGQAPKPPLPAS